ncbi:DUF2809 domain-containing protein [Polaromonas sp. SM01]|uniref:ribosomal maturation YjgA family protein n=1 Tax=Polaromonas sp. SM01 TaxID=3085630 RepID=UPI00298125AD|nr:DUF2809 domain-containing protein [Polaromonas sp. SM01]MDW5442681.1 DUF2809 domain-containing protein [Polaromonas sp. SM01]
MSPSEHRPGVIAWRFDREALAWAVLIFIVEVLIATVWARHRWLRGFFGDLLAVVWVYYLFKTVLRAPVPWLAGAAFGVGCLVELGQYLAAAQGWQVAHPVLRIVLGSVADWLDVLAYAVGFLMVLGLERLCERLRPVGMVPNASSK